jgi:hypothetical protein
MTKKTQPVGTVLKVPSIGCQVKQMKLILSPDWIENYFQGVK